MKSTWSFATGMLFLAAFAATGCQKDGASRDEQGAMEMRAQRNNGNNGNNGNGNNGNGNNGNNGNNGGGSSQCNTCYYGQGHWFASMNHTWPDMNGNASGSVTVGGHHYTMAEGHAIWRTSNAGGKKHSKKAYTLVASLKLSNYCGTYAGYPMGHNYMTDLATVEAWLAGMNKLSPSNMPSTHMPSNVMQAYERLKAWMEMKECEDDDDDHDD